jgi:ABC-2 type transport system ATP-binding protein
MLSEIESICDDVVILNLGQIVARGTVAEVIGRTQQNLVLDSALRIRVPAEYVVKAKQILKTSLPAVLSVSPIGEMEGWLRVDIVDSANGNNEVTYLINNSILSTLIRAKIPILSFEAEGARLQDVFLHLTEAMQ